jgi:AraC-like DNA-binding protein
VEERGGHSPAILHNNPPMDSRHEAWRKAIPRVGYRLPDAWNLRGPLQRGRARRLVRARTRYIRSRHAPRERTVAALRVRRDRMVCTMSLTTVMLRVLADGVGQYGVSVDELVRGTVVLPELFGRPDGFVRGDEFEPLLCRAVALTGDSAFGLHWAERSSFAAFDLLGHVAAAVPTFADALAIIIHLFPLLSDGHELALHLEDHAATLEFRLPRCAPPSSHVREEFIVASSLRLLRRFAGSSGMPSSAHFTYAAPAHRSEYTRFFGGAERFEQPFTGMVVDRRLLDARQLCHDEELERDLRIRAEARLQRSTVSSDRYAKRVKDWLFERPFVGRGEMKAVAEGLRISERSLRRHLAIERTSFPRLRMEALSARAKQLLLEPDLPIKEVASSMGFSDATAVHRAFRTWTGMTPAAFRAAAFVSGRGKTG